MARGYSSLSSSSIDSFHSPPPPRPSLRGPSSTSPSDVRVTVFDADDPSERYRDSLSDSSSAESLGEAFEREREERGRRQAEREARRVEGRARDGREAYTMRSLGMNRTQLKHILPSFHHDPAALPFTQPGAPSTGPTDLQHQATLNLQRRKRTSSTLSRCRIAYIALVGVLCLVLIVVGSILCAKAVSERAEAEEKAGGEEAVFARAVGTGTNALVDVLKSAEEVLGVGGSAHGTATSGEVPYTGTATLPPATVPSATGIFSRFPELQELLEGNREWRGESEEEDPGLIQELAKGQAPKFAYIGCADSRVPETTVLGTKPGDIFVTRNVGNQYIADDLSSETVMSYAIAHLGVQHLVIMGHTECGAVQAAIASPSEEASTDEGEGRIAEWIAPIRALYNNSTRSEIVEFRDKAKQLETVTANDVEDPVWQALVEENVKYNVQLLAQDASVLKSWSAWKEYAEQGNITSTASAHARRSSAESETPVELWVHGWVYNVSTGLVNDLGVSVGPDGAYTGA
ncbi:hypothetical protein JCM10207_006165 [Rhodosporidiobolus poonsookiae]